jgi:hypothetical protein
MKTRLFLCLLCFACVLSGQTAIESDYELLKNMTLNGKTYTVYFKSNADKCQFKVGDKETTEFKNSIDVHSFFIFFTTFIKMDFDSGLDVLTITESEKNAITQLITAIKVAEASKKSERDQILGEIDNAKDQYSGELILHEMIKTFKVIEPSHAAIRKYYSHYYTKAVDQGKVSYTLSDTNTCNHKNDTLVLSDATVIFFNNKASTIALNAKLICADGREDNLEFYNYRYSIPVRAFTYYENDSKLILSKYVLTADLPNGQSIEIHANDIFDYRSFGDGRIGNFGFSIANQRLHISNDKKLKRKSNPVKVVQRRFFDFFTGVIYSDLMGLNTKTSNSLVNAQASLLMPMNLGNWAEVSALRQFRVNVIVALNNSFENEARYIGFKDSDKVNHFDLYRKSNLVSVLSLDLMSYESKGWFLTSSFGYNLGFNRTGYQYTKTIDNAADEVSTGQLLSIIHGPYLNFEFRPQDNFGADIMIRLDEMNLNDDDVIDGKNLSEEILVSDRSNSFLAKHNMVNVSANFYWLVNPGKSDGGVYAKVGVAYHTPTEASYPQLMVGYATNLTSFVNRFKVKENTNKPTSN